MRKYGLSKSIFTMLLLFLVVNTAVGLKTAYCKPQPKTTTTQTISTQVPPVIDVSQVFVQAENDEKSVLALLNDALALDQNMKAPDRLEERIELSLKKIEKMHKQHVLTINFINQAVAEWQKELGQLESYFQYLGENLKKIESAKAEITTMRDKWLSSGDAYQKIGQMTAHQRAMEMLVFFDDNLKKLENASKERLTEQEKIGAQKSSLEDHIKYLTDMRQMLALSKWQQDKPSVVSRDFYSSFRWLGTASVMERWSQYWVEASDYYRSAQKKVAVELIVVLLLWWYLRGRFKKITDDEETTSSEEIRAILRHSFMISLLLVALAASLWHKSAPVLVTEIINVFVFIPVVVFLLELIKEKQLKLFLWGMALTYLLGIIRTFFMGFAPWDRLFTIIHISLGLAIAIVFYPRGESAKLIFGEGGAFKWSARGKVALWWLFAIALLMQLAGYHTGSLIIVDGAFGSVYLSLGVLALYRLFKSFFALVISSKTLQKFKVFLTRKELVSAVINIWFKRIAFLFWFYFLLKIWSLDESVGNFLSKIGKMGFRYGENRFNIEKLFLALVTIYFSILLARLIRFLLEEEVYPRREVPEGVRGMISQTIKYFIVLIGFLMGLSLLGVKLQNITILASAFGVGIGFGLQNIVNNFVSGIILFIERPIKIGDVFELNGTSGLVKKIGIRTTIIETWDKAEIIIPNGEILSGKLTNWSLSDRQARLVIPVDVAYGSSPRQVIDLLLQTANKHTEVLKEPPPSAFFLGFGDSALQFELRCFVADVSTRIRISSELRTAIYEEFNKAGIEIPFPQRDVYIKSLPK